jgi:Flp pilus assembly protein TadD
MIDMNIDVDSWRRRIREETFSRYHYEMGRAIEQEGNSEAAIESYRRVLTILPDEPATCFRLASLLRRLDRNEQAQAVEAQATKSDPRYPASAWHSFAQQALESGRYEEAVAALEQALSLDPDLVPDSQISAAYSALAVVADSGHQCAKARELAYKGLRLWPDIPSLWRILGYTHIWEGNFESALEIFTRGVALAPTDAMMQSGLGWALLGLGRLNEAERHHAHAIIVEPQSSMVFGFAIFAPCARKDVAAAEALVERALALDSRNAFFWAQQGAIAFLDGRFTAAESALRQALTLTPEHNLAESNLALVLEAMGRTDEAIEMHRRSILHFGSRRRGMQRLRPWAATALADAYGRLGVEGA